MNAVRAPLDVWLDDVPVGQLHDVGGGRCDLVWGPDAAARLGLRSRVLGHLLPVGAVGEKAGAAVTSVVLNGLMPEGSQRTHRATAAGIDPGDLFALMARFGQDTAGALVVQAAASPAPSNGTRVPVPDHEIAAMLDQEGRSTSGSPPTSLAGVQPKVSLYRDHSDGRWYRWVDRGPTTHIIKLGSPEGSPTFDVIDTEAASLDLARRIGLTTVDAHVQRFADVRALVISRYDRVRLADGSIRRLHQEDAAQALGINTADMERKFQRGRVLPSLAAIAGVLAAGGAEPDRLLALTTFNLAIGNTDAHAKNISLVRPVSGPVRLAPAYDVAMHGHHPSTQRRFAMHVNGKDDLDALTADDLLKEAQGWGLPGRRAQQVVFGTLERLLQALQDIDRTTHPGVSDHAWSVVERRVSELVRTVEIRRR